eukprot:1078678-Pleurochrysis_carterae.AAC.1
MKQDTRFPEKDADEIAHEFLRDRCPSNVINAHRDWMRRNAAELSKPTPPDPVPLAPVAGGVQTRRGGVPLAPAPVPADDPVPALAPAPALTELPWKLTGYGPTTLRHKECAFKECAFPSSLYTYSASILTA